MFEKSTTLGWLKYDTEIEANNLISKINNCLGFPTPDGRTITWIIPSCFQDDYEGNETERGWFVVIKNECYDCLTTEEQLQIITSIPDGWVKCGTIEPPITGSTENY